jgi:hypothetical protein
MSERLTDATIREAMEGLDLLSPNALDLWARGFAAEALARGSEVEGLRAEVERLTRERDEARDSVTALASVAIDGSHDGVAPAGLVAQQGIAAIRGLRAEVARLRAAALPEDAEMRIAKELFAQGVEGAGNKVENFPWTIAKESWKERARGKARAVLAALRGAS